jgi:hypothetical protein
MTKGIVVSHSLTAGEDRLSPVMKFIFADGSGEG